MVRTEYFNEDNEAVSLDQLIYSQFGWRSDNHALNVKALTQVLDTPTLTTEQRDSVSRVIETFKFQAIIDECIEANKPPPVPRKPRVTKKKPETIEEFNDIENEKSQH